MTENTRVDVFNQNKWSLSAFVGNVKNEVVEEILEPLKDKNPNAIRGAVFFGPHGTGKTYLAKILAIELDAPITVAYSGSAIKPINTKKPHIIVVENPENWSESLTKSVKEVLETSPNAVVIITMIDERSIPPDLLGFRRIERFYQFQLPSEEERDLFLSRFTLI